MTPPAEGTTMEAQLAIHDARITALEVASARMERKLDDILQALAGLSASAKLSHTPETCYALSQVRRDVDALGNREREQEHTLQEIRLEIARAKGAAQIMGAVWGVVAGIITALVVAAVKAWGG
jgi:hypothetical protein